MRDIGFSLSLFCRTVHAREGVPGPINTQTSVADEVLRGYPPAKLAATTIAKNKDHVQMLGTAHMSGWLLFNLPTVARCVRAKADVAMVVRKNDNYAIQNIELTRVRDARVA